MKVNKKILLVEPEFPYPNKSKHKANSVHKNFVPIGLLKLGAYYKSKGDKVKLVRGRKSKKELSYYNPDKVIVTSLFTYWSKYVWDSIKYYRELFQKAEIETGGVYVTLHHQTEKFVKLAKRYQVKSYAGVHEEAEKFLPDYSLLEEDVDYHATHAMRGCIRRCAFCGTWRIEPKLRHKTAEQVIGEIKKVGKSNVIFYDNNFLANPNVKDILKAIAKLKINNKPVNFECQSGFDGRLLEKDPEFATLLKKAGFQNIRIAWDNSIKDALSIKKQVDYLVKAGYPPKNISIFMIYNFNISYKDMIKKLNYCKKLGVQIIDCRYRPLESTSDNYSPHAFRTGQTEKDYHIHSEAGWSDKKVRNFRKSVRKHNIWIRYAKDKGLEYDKRMEKWSAIHSTFKFFNLGRPPGLEVLENGYGWKERIQVMNKIKNHYKREGIKAPNFGSLKIKELDSELKKCWDFRLD
ncbi:radical SAM protein [bacterium]|nr:radical SAM protein [bacterium]